jgi:glutamate synthase domain-containing protein 1/glutamate synthase domain-containing protein 3
VDRAELATVLLDSERALAARAGVDLGRQAPKQEMEGGCGVVGMAASIPVPGRALEQALVQMRNRGNGKGGGIAAVGLDPDFFGIDPKRLREEYLLAIAYLDPAARSEVERTSIEPTFAVSHSVDLPARWETQQLGLEVAPPRVRCYFGTIRPDALAGFMQANGIGAEDGEAAADELVFQNTYRLNSAFYASSGEKRAFVLSHGKNMLVLKLVGYGEDVVRAYGLEDLTAHIWIGHHRYPTKGRVWHPGGAHPFIGLNEALVHNGDFANYSSICASLAQRGRHPLFLTDTEVAALVFDLLYRVYGYPLEYVIEALAPTTERDFALLPEERRRIYSMLQATHMHLSPDGPWYFLVAQSSPQERLGRLIGITDTSMLRPQVFALQQGQASIGLAASEKQAIDAALEACSQVSPKFWGRADLYWSARGGSHTDGGAFAFNVALGEAGPRLWCSDKFGRLIQTEQGRSVPGQDDCNHRAKVPTDDARRLAGRDGSANELADEAARQLPAWGPEGLDAFLAALKARATGDQGRDLAFAVLARLIDHPYRIAPLKRSYVLALLDRGLDELVALVRRQPSDGYVWISPDGPASTVPTAVTRQRTVVLDARGWPPDGPSSLARTIVDLYHKGARRFTVVNARGHRFVGCGLGPGSKDVRIDIFGSSGDYLASGIDGAEVVVHGSAQDQVAQILKEGRLVIHGDVGQTFMYGAKGGDVFVRGGAAGRPLINGVGRPRVVINGTCLDYLAESFMAGDPLHGGGFVVLNGIRSDEDGSLSELESPYPGGNIFSLASGGAVYVRDPRGQLGDDQLNGGQLVELAPADWELIRPYLEQNESLFDIPLNWLLSVDGCATAPERVYRKIVAAGLEALSPEEVWVRPKV